MPRPTLLALLQLDIKQTGVKTLEDAWTNGDRITIQGPLVLQIVSISNLNQPTPNQDAAHAAPGSRLLMVKLTDGHIKVTGIEFTTVEKLSMNTPPGTKVKLLNVPLRRGKLLLTPDNCKIMGGNVDKLVENWRTARAMAASKKVGEAIQVALQEALAKKAAAAPDGGVGTGTAAASSSSAALKAAGGASTAADKPPPFLAFDPNRNYAKGGSVNNKATATSTAADAAHEDGAASSGRPGGGKPSGPSIAGASKGAAASTAVRDDRQGRSDRRAGGDDRNLNHKERNHKGTAASGSDAAYDGVAQPSHSRDAQQRQQHSTGGDGRPAARDGRTVRPPPAPSAVSVALQSAESGAAGPGASSSSSLMRRGRGDHTFGSGGRDEVYVAADEGYVPPHLRNKQAQQQKQQQTTYTAAGAGAAGGASEYVPPHLRDKQRHAQQRNRSDNDASMPGSAAAVGAGTGSSLVFNAASAASAPEWRPGQGSGPGAELAQPPGHHRPEQRQHPRQPPHAARAAPVGYDEEQETREEDTGIESVFGTMGIGSRGRGRGRGRGVGTAHAAHAIRYADAGVHAGAAAATAGGVGQGVAAAAPPLPAALPTAAGDDADDFWGQDETATGGGGAFAGSYSSSRAAGHTAAGTGRGRGRGRGAAAAAASVSGPSVRSIQGRADSSLMEFQPPIIYDDDFGRNYGGDDGYGADAAAGGWNSMRVGSSEGRGGASRGRGRGGTSSGRMPMSTAAATTVSAGARAPPHATASARASATDASRAAAFAPRDGTGFERNRAAQIYAAVTGEDAFEAPGDRTHAAAAASNDGLDGDDRRQRMREPISGVGSRGGRDLDGARGRGGRGGRRGGRDRGGPEGATSADGDAAAARSGGLTLAAFL